MGALAHELPLHKVGRFSFLLFLRAGTWLGFGHHARLFHGQHRDAVELRQAILFHHRVLFRSKIQNNRPRAVFTLVSF